jgi:ubiquinone/menaquinone biosynthesis C-methylase UbiE
MARDKRQTAGRVSADNVREFYDDPSVVEHYRRATANVGLWVSEELVLRRVFDPGDRILELGTGTGRIAIGLNEIGYRHLMGIDLCREMIVEARRINKVLGAGVSFRQGDATRLKFEDGLFDGAIFGFNGLMQIPGREARRAALREIHRVVRPGAALVFTTHDRNASKHGSFWKKERQLWSRGRQKPELIEFGDRFDETDLGRLYIHVPTPEDVREELKVTGWKCEWDSLRSAIAHESPEVRRFSDECRFWVARKPDDQGTDGPAQSPGLPSTRSLK